MSKKTTINLEINTNADEAAKEFENLSKATEVANDSLEGLNKTFEEANGDIQPLTARMGEAEDRLYELALAGDTTSKEYQGLLTKVGEYRKVQIQTDLAVDGAATTMTQKLGSALNGATSGFAATQGAMALFGSENEALEKSLLKVQSALAIQQGVQGLTEAYRELGIGTKIAGLAQAAFTFVTGGATTALKLFRVALISTGVGALVAALGTLYANLDSIVIILKFAVQGLKDFADAIGLSSFAEADAAALQKDAETQRLQMIKDIRASQEEAHKRRMAEMAEERRASEQGWNDWLDILRLQGQEERANFIERTTLSEAFWFDRTKDVSEYTNEELKAYKALLEFDKKVAEERKRNYQEYAAARMSAARQIEDIENSLLQDGIEKELEINRDKFRRLREDAEKNTKLTRKERARLIELFDDQELAQQKLINQKYVDLEKEKNAKIDEEREKLNQERIDKEDALFQLELDLMKDRQMAEIIALSQGYEEKYLLAEGNAELTKQLEAQFLLDQAAIEDKFRQEKAAKEKEATDKSIAEAQAEADAKLAIQNAQIGIAEAGIGLIKELAGENKKILAAALIAENAAGVAKIIINTVAANAKAVVASPLTAGQPWVSINSIGAGIGIASSVAATAKGLSALGGGGSPDSGSVPSGGASSAAVPNFNVVGDSGINQIAALQSTPVQAFVVSGEVTTSQALDRNRVQNATL
jgi:hypothetical protein